jgi:hypothetical protein
VPPSSRHPVRWAVHLSAIAFVASAIAAGAATAFAAAGAAHSQQRKVPFKAVAQLATISSRDGYPAVGGGAVLSGPLTQHPGGPGAEVDHVTITGHPSANVFTSRATGVDYLAHGSERFNFTSTITVEPDGSLKLVGRGSVTGGTDRYRGLRGHFTFTGSAPTPAGIITYHATGSIVQR